MADRVRQLHWSATPLGPLEGWTAAQINATNLMLACCFPALVFLGPELVVLYNDDYLDPMADKHPRALGLPARQVWPEAWHVIGPQLAEVMPGGASTLQENLLIPVIRDGSFQDVWWTYSYSPIYEPDGAISGVFVVVHDVTLELLTTRERNRVADQLRQVMDATTEAVFTLDRSWRFTLTNPAALRLIAPVSDVLGKNCWELFPGMIYDGSPFVDHYRRAMDEGISSEFEAFYGDPYNVWLKVQVRSYSDGIAIFCHDVTEERNRETERTRLLEDRLRFFTLVESSTDFIGISDMRGIPFYANPAALRLVGLESLDALQGADIGALFFPEDRRMIREELLLRVKRDGAAHMEVRFRHFATGNAIWVNYRVFLLRDAQNQPIGFATVSHDLTEQKQTAEALIKTEKLAAVGRLAASIAHEINNPLEAVTNLIYLAQHSAGMDEVKSYIESAERELRRVSAIANQTLRFHKQASSPQPVFPAELLDGVLSIYQGRILNSNVRVERRDRCPEPVTCFDGEVRQVLSNLIGNAIDAMHPRGGRLLVRSRPACDWKTERPGVVLTVADTGAGIEPALLPRIFEPFFTTKGFNGTGLGLWVSQEIAARHHGSLRVRSRKDAPSGTVFTLFLPCEAARRV